MDILKFQELVWYLNLFLHIPGSSIPCGESFQRHGGAAFKCNTTKMSVELLVYVLSFRYPILLASEQGTFHCFLQGEILCFFQGEEQPKKLEQAKQALPKDSQGRQNQQAQKTVQNQGRNMGQRKKQNTTNEYPEISIPESLTHANPNRNSVASPTNVKSEECEPMYNLRVKGNIKPETPL